MNRTDLYSLTLSNYASTLYRNILLLLLLSTLLEGFAMFHLVIFVLVYKYNLMGIWCKTKFSGRFGSGKSNKNITPPIQRNSISMCYNRWHVSLTTTTTTGRSLVSFIWLPSSQKILTKRSPIRQGYFFFSNYYLSNIAKRLSVTTVTQTTMVFKGNFIKHKTLF